MNIHYVTGNEELLDAIQFLWEELNKIHLEKSVHFRDFYSRNTFEIRKETLLKTAQKGHMLIVLAYDEDFLIGYCVASLVDGVGEIDSLFVSVSYRGNGIGKHLMEKSLNWLKQNAASKTVIKVSVGNEDVFGFYTKHGFFPRLSELQMISE
jgi:ribosomal protein S18 acetylase RimI-like enzyme